MIRIPHLEPDTTTGPLAKPFQFYWSNGTRSAPVSELFVNNYDMQFCIYANDPKHGYAIWGVVPKEERDKIPLMLELLAAGGEFVLEGE